MSEENRALALRWFDEVWNQRRTATIDELLSPTCVGHMEGAEIRHPNQFKQVHAALLDAFPDLKIVVEDTAADGDCVVLRWRVQGTHGGGGLGFAASGKPVEFRGMTWQRFASGKLVEGWDSWNQGELFANLRPVAAATQATVAPATTARKPRRGVRVARRKPKPRARSKPKAKRGARRRR
jgi:steroid delta-isomerase-like uncharacterized protein